jgi:hypothetical protein
MIRAGVGTGSMTGGTKFPRLAEKYLWDVCDSYARSYRTLRDGSSVDAFPGTSCQATIMVSLRDEYILLIKLALPTLNPGLNGAKSTNDWEIQSPEKRTQSPPGLATKPPCSGPEIVSTPRTMLLTLSRLRRRASPYLKPASSSA